MSKRKIKDITKDISNTKDKLKELDEELTLAMEKNDLISKKIFYNGNFEYVDNSDGKELFNTENYPTKESALKAYQEHNEFTEEEAKDFKIRLLENFALEERVEFGECFVTFEYFENQPPKLFTTWEVWW